MGYGHKFRLKKSLSQNFKGFGRREISLCEAGSVGLSFQDGNDCFQVMGMERLKMSVEVMTACEHR